jgi:hypothetical protein
LCVDNDRGGIIACRLNRFQAVCQQGDGFGWRFGLLRKTQQIPAQRVPTGQLAGNTGDLLAMVGIRAGVVHLDHETVKPIAVLRAGFHTTSLGHRIATGVPTDIPQLLTKIAKAKENNPTEKDHCRHGEPVATLIHQTDVVDPLR